MMVENWFKNNISIQFIVFFQFFTFFLFYSFFCQRAFCEIIISAVYNFLSGLEEYIALIGFYKWDSS